jgi:biopolymer transport protein ExbD
MKLNRRFRRPFADNSASSDIAFLLIIYFLVMAGFTVNQGFLLNQPEKDSLRIDLNDDLLRLSMDASGDLF